MKTKVVRIYGMYCVIFKPVGLSVISKTIVRVSDGCIHYALWMGGSYGMDYLPGGKNYLGDTWADAMKALGIEEEVERPDDDCP